MSPTMPLSTTEELGFQALAACEHRPTWIEGGLVVGAVAISALLSFASQSLAELSDEEIRNEYQRYYFERTGKERLDLQDYRSLIKPEPRLIRLCLSRRTKTSCPSKTFLEIMKSCGGIGSRTRKA